VSCRCGHSFGAGFDWKQRAAERVAEATSHGPFIRLHPELELREFACPSCGTLLECEVARIGAPSLQSVELS
jgi:N-methylhydantoinase B